MQSVLYHEMTEPTRRFAGLASPVAWSRLSLYWTSAGSRRHARGSSNIRKVAPPGGQRQPAGRNAGWRKRLFHALHLRHPANASASPVAPFPTVSIVVIVEGSKDCAQHGTASALCRRHGAGTARRLAWRCRERSRSAERRLSCDFHRFPDELVRRAIRAFPPNTWRRRSTCRSIRCWLQRSIMPAKASWPATLPAALIEHRLMEVLMVLGMRGALPSSPETTARPCARWSAGSRTAPGRPISSPPSSAPATQHCGGACRRKAHRCVT